MIARFIKIFIGVVVVLIVASTAGGIIPLEAILPTAIPLSVVVFIGIALLKKRGVIPNSDRDTARETTNYNTSQHVSRSTSTPKEKAPKVKTATKAAKPKMPKPKCKRARIIYFSDDNTMYCYCNSPNAPSLSRYANVSRKNGEKVTGSSHHQGESGNMWKLCINGRWHGGITPSKCSHYVTPK